MTQTSSILIRIATRTDWDKIPADVIKIYEDEIAKLHLSGTRGRAFKVQATEIYNIAFSRYGYTKPEIQ